MRNTIVMDALDVTLELLAPGASYVTGQDTLDTVPEGKVGLLIVAHDSAVTVIGTPQQLRDRVYEGFGLPVPDGVPLVDEPSLVFLADPNGGGAWIPAPENHTED